MFSFRPRSPKPFKQDAFRVELLAGAREFGDDMAAAFEPKTADWEGDAPEYVPQVSLSGGAVKVELALTGTELALNKFIWNDLDTKAHTIRPRSRKALRFVAGGDLVFSKVVRHPGTTGKGWSKEIAAAMKPIFTSRMGEAMARGAARSGHGR